MNQARVLPNVSFLNLTYPFGFDQAPFPDILQSVQQCAWQINIGSPQVWGERQMPQDDLLPHVANYLYFNNDKIDPLITRGDLGSAHFWRMETICRESPQGLGCQRNNRWEVHVDNKPPIPIQLRNIDLSLFSHGIGFITIQLEVLSDQIADWADAQNRLRFANGSRAPLLRVERKSGKDQYAEFTPAPQQIGTATPTAPPTPFTMEALLSIILTAAGFQDSKSVQELFVAGRMLPYLVLYVNRQVSPEPKHPHGQGELKQLLYQLRRIFHSTQHLHPSPQNLTLKSKYYLNYARNQWFWFSLEGGGFLAVDAPDTPFFRSDLPIHLDDQYFLIFLIALQQRFTLMSLSNEVAHSWIPVGKNLDTRLAVFRSIRDRLFNFTARGYFCQVMQRENHHRCYLRWQNVFQISKLYEEVQGEVRDMHDYITDQQRRQRDLRVTLFTLLLSIIVGAPTLAMAFLSINLEGITAKEEGLPVGSALGWVALWTGAFARIFTVIRIGITRWTKRSTD